MDCIKCILQYFNCFSYFGSDVEYDWDDTWDQILIGVKKQQTDTDDTDNSCDGFLIVN